MSSSLNIAPTVILFDIDGTLVDTGGSGRRAITRAFDTVYKRPDAASKIRYAGMTDRAIVREGLQVIGAAESDAAIDAFLDVYLPYLLEELVEPPGYRVLDGVHELLAALRTIAPLAIGLGTGNIEKAAYAKLRPGSLHAEFDFGGFGSDSETRSELLRHGAERGARRLGVDKPPVVVIGDTLHDVRAANAINARCLAVVRPQDRDEARSLGAITFDSLLDVTPREVFGP